MATAIYSTDNRIGVDVNYVFVLDTTTPEYPAPPFLVGCRASGTDGSEWIYSTASITIGAGNVVLFSTLVQSTGTVGGAWSVALAGGVTAAGNTGVLAGVVGGSTGTMTVPSPTTTQNMYFWTQVAGNCPNVATLASTTAYTTLHTNPTLAGVLFSSGGGTSTTFIINGIVISNATGSAAGPNTAILNFPAVVNPTSGG
jgi:hypothetical protein